MRDEAERLLARVPDASVLHHMLANIAREEEEDVVAVSRDWLPWGTALASTPDRARLVELSWRVAAHHQRLRRELPTTEIAGERTRLFADLASFDPLEPADQVRKEILLLTMHAMGEDDITPHALDAARRIGEHADPGSLYVIAVTLHRSADHEPGVRAVQRELIERLLASDPASERYDGYLLLDARARKEDDARAAIRSLLANGLSPRYEDDAWVQLAGLHERKTLPADARAALESLVYIEPRRRNTTAHAALVLASERWARDFPEAALDALDTLELRFGPQDPDIVIARARLLLHLERPVAALLALQESLRRGDTDYSRWYHAARCHQMLGNEPEAVRLYQFYLARVTDRASGRLPFGTPAPFAFVLQEQGRVWYRFAEMHPTFFARSGVRQFVETLALLAAGLLAAARFRRARAFVLPGLLAGEIVFFAGLLALRLEAAGAAIPVFSWAWLGTASVRAFVLVSAGLYVSALAGLPRHTRSLTGPTVAIAASCLAGLVVGLAYPPIFVLEGVPGFARVAELGVAPEALAEIPVVLVSALRTEAAARLVWPALVLTALSALDLGAFSRAAAAIAITAVLCAAGSAASFPLALAGAAVLTLARFHWGAAVPFLLHGTYVLSASAAALLRT